MLVNKIIYYGLATFLLTNNLLFADVTEKQQAIAITSFSIPNELKSWNEKQQLPLQPHQLTPIAYLEKNPDIKGLIINHWLGTGKTLLAIGFAERNPDHPVVILAPGFLEGHWMRELERYGANKKRYRFVSHNNPKALTQEDLSKTILIVDESHRLIEKVRASDKDPSYAPLYLNLRKAHRILSLTGTPIYNDPFDLVYQINFVSQKEELPFNKEEFRVNYSKVDAFKSYWRGYLLESFGLKEFASSTKRPIQDFLELSKRVDSEIADILAPIPMRFYHFLPYFIDIRKNPMRSFDVDKLKGLISKYVSYYNFDQNARFYPSKSFVEKALSYNDPQLSIVYRFYDSGLEREEMTQLLKDQTDSSKEKDIVQEANYYLNSSLVQDLYKNKIGAGRELGNLLFINQSAVTKENKDIHTFTKSVSQYTIFPEKFECILKEIEKSKGPTIIYSHYYCNGLLLFKQFLDAQGYQEKYRIFHPEALSKANTNLVDEYNNNKVKILLLHPDITEGISLKGTRQVHFLDMPTSSELANQIIGRAIRYQSHMHLPKSDQHVSVYYWYYHFPFFEWKQKIAERVNWYHNFSELAYGTHKSRAQVDKNAYLKSNTPDMLSYVHFSALNKQTEQFRRYVEKFCIENACCELES